MSSTVFQAAASLAEMVPVIAKWFRGKATGSETARMLAGKIVDMARNVTGSSDTLSAIRILEKDPKLLLQFQQMVTNMDYELQRAYLDDRQDARTRDMAYVASGRTNFRADVMVIAAAVGLLSCLVALAIYQNQLPGEAVGIISTVAGIFGACLKDAYAFEFGSSRDSKQKDAVDMLKKMVSEENR